LSPWDPDKNSYVNKSIFGRLATETRRRAEADGIGIVYGTPNRNAYPGWTKRLDYFDLERCGLRAFARPTAKMAVVLYPKADPLRGILRRLDSASMSLWKRYLSWGQRRRTFEPGIAAPDELDDLWRRTRKPDRFSLVRDAQYWRHRYVGHPLARYEIFSVREAGRLCGVAVTRKFSAGQGMQQLAIAEWMHEENFSFGWLLAAIVDRHKNSGIDFYRLYAGDGTYEAKALARNLFLRRPRIPVILANTPEARRIESDRGRVELHMGGTDAV
jgi:hypothetical protein